MHRSRRAHRAQILYVATAGLFAVNSAFALPAFPGAEGFGANANGGRGGDVYHVTTLADDPTHSIPGSLFYGLYEKNVPGSGTVPGVGRTIVFDVGGTIYLNQGSTLDIKNIKNVTIAGQTAPTPITIVGNNVQITSSSNKETGNIIMRHLNLRKGVGDGEDALSIKGSGNTHNIIVDHVSGSWSEDEVISVTQKANNVTIQNSTLSEALTSAHAYGSLIRPMMNSNVSYNRNLYSNQKSRNPRPGTYDGMTLSFEFQNNVIYNWSDRAGYAGGSSEGDTEYVNMNFIGNYMVAGPSTPASKRNVAFTRDSGNSPIVTRIYQNGNFIDSNSNTTRDGVDSGWGMFNNWDGTTTTAYPESTVADPDIRRTAPYAYPSAAAADSALIAYEKVIGSVGAFPWQRNATDQRLINDVLNYTGFAPITAPPTAEWNAIINQPMSTRPAGWDTDRDGMPNGWESARGLNPAVADNNGIASNLYTNLENYLNELAAQAVWNLNADGNWSSHINWRGERPNSILATATFAPGITAPRTVTVDSAVDLAQLTFESSVAYTLSGAGPIRLDVVGGYAAIDATGAGHTIAAPVVFNDNVHINVNGAASTLSLTGDLSAADRAITKKGDGVLGAKNIRAASLNITGGKVTIAPSASPAADTGTSVVQSLSIAAGAQLDLTNNAAVIDYASVGSLLTDVRDHVAAGRIDSSTADANHDIGYADNSSLNLATFAGQSVDTSSLLLRYTRKGDANLDGITNISDFSALAAAFNQSGFWQNGDFDHSGTVNITDFSLLAANFNQSATFARSVVPEPAFGIFALASVALFVRRKK